MEIVEHCSHKNSNMNFTQIGHMHPCILKKKKKTSKYSQTFLRRPALGLTQSGCLIQVAVLSQFYDWRDSVRPACYKYHVHVHHIPIFMRHIDCSI